jgi:hypothetical protein
MFLLSILTGGGLLGGIAMMVLRPALRATVGSFFKGLPREVWYALAALAVLAGLWFWHSHAVSTAYRQGNADGIVATDKKWNAAFTTMSRAADQWKKNFELRSEQLADAQRTAHDQELRRIAADADDLRLRGAGRAAAPRCGPGSGAAVAASASGHQDSPAGPGAPASPLPAGDGLRDEVKTWRSWYDEQGQLQRASLDALRATLRDANPAFGN